jgi:hypothetical protein
MIEVILKEKLGKLDFDDEQSLLPMDELSEVFLKSLAPPYCRASACW